MKAEAHTITLLRFDREGGSQWVITTDMPYARHLLIEAGAQSVETGEITEVIRQQFGDLAMLATFG